MRCDEERDEECKKEGGEEKEGGGGGGGGRLYSGLCAFSTLGRFGPC